MKRKEYDEEENLKRSKEVKSQYNSDEENGNYWTPEEAEIVGQYFSY